MLGRLNAVVTADKYKAVVEYVELYLSDTESNSTFYPEVDSWVSKLDKCGGSMILFKLASITGTNTSTRIKSEITSWYLLENDDGVTKITELENEFRSKNFIPSKFEKALILAGPFPLLFICNYLNLVQYREFSPTPVTDPRATTIVQNTYSPRDFAIGLVQYLEYTGRGLAKNDTARTYGYVVVINSEIKLLKCEMTQVGSMSLKFSRLFYFHLYEMYCIENRGRFIM